MVGLVVFAIFVLVALAAPWVAPYDPLKTNFLLVRKPPSALYWFGTDEIGRDVFSRVVWGARASLLAGVVSVAIAVAIGVPLGLLSGYARGWVDGLLMRITDGLLACPGLILAIAMAAFLGPSLTNAMIAIGITAMPVFIRLTRGQVLAVTVEDYVEAARAGQPADAHRHPPRPAQHPAADHGAGDAGDGVRHHRRGRIVVPRPRPAAAGALLGIDAERRPQLHRPGALDVLVAGPGHRRRRAGLNLLGDGLRDAFDPKED